MYKFLVTGGSGFIGTNLISYLINAHPGSSILNLDIIPPRDSSHNRFYHFCDINCYSSLLSKVQCFLPTHVFHLAATTGIGQLPLDHFKTNINGVQNIVNVLTIVGSVKRVIFASSLLVCKVGYIPDSYDEYLPSTSYGISKMKGEIIVKSSASDFDWL